MNILEEYGKGYYEEVSTKEIDEFLDKYSLESPKEFYKFYSQYNGFKLLDQDLQLVYRFDEPFGVRDQLEFDSFLPTDTLFINYESNAGVAFPKGTIPFIDPQEGEIVISLRKDSFGKIYFCESNPTNDQMPEDAFETVMAKFSPMENQLPGTVKELAGSFNEFINLLKIEEW